MNNVDSYLEINVKMCSIMEDKNNFNVLINDVSLKCVEQNIKNSLDAYNYIFSMCGLLADREMNRMNQMQPAVSNMNMQYENMYGMQYSDGRAQSKPWLDRPKTISEFYKHPLVSSEVKSIVGCGITCYVITGLYILLIAVQVFTIFSILDALLILGCGLGLHLGKSRAAAIVLTCEAGFGMIVGILVRGRLTGYFLLILAITALIKTFKVKSEWKKYRETGRLG